MDVKHQSRCEQCPGMCMRDPTCPDTTCPGRQQAIEAEIGLTPPGKAALITLAILLAVCLAAAWAPVIFK